MKTRDSASDAPPILNAYAATRCARRAHNDFDQTIPAGEPFEVSAQGQLFIDAGITHEVAVRRQLAERLGTECIDINDMELFGEAAIEATVAAMTAGMPVILGGWLPTDLRGGRSGKPDALVRVSAAGDLDARYVPIEIKGHLTLKKCSKSARPARVSTTHRPFPADATENSNQMWRGHEGDALQLAHYWRMLQACGRAPDESATGGIIGPDDFGDGYLVVWCDLELPQFNTFSRSSATGSKARSALERYDHEFAFRSDIATIARARVGGAEDPLALVEPIRIKDCDRCPWFAFCADSLPSDASFEVGTLTAREWHTLRGLGYTTVEEIASLDVDELVNGQEVDTPTGRLLADYLPEVANMSRANARLAKVVTAAKMVVDGVYFRRITDGPIDVPRADVEIDFDIEFDTSPFVYLWGMFTTDRTSGESRYEHIADWLGAGGDAEAVLGLSFWNWLNAQIDRARVIGQTLRVYHYTAVEPESLRRVLTGAKAGPSAAEVKAVIDEYFVDLYPIVKANLVGRDGLGLKVVAVKAAGFAWRDEDPGGAQSMAWREEARNGDKAAETRILEYNEDDVRATWAVREWLDSNPS